MAAPPPFEREDEMAAWLYGGVAVSNCLVVWGFLLYHVWLHRKLRSPGMNDIEAGEQPKERQRGDSSSRQEGEEKEAERERGTPCAATIGQEGREGRRTGRSDREEKEEGGRIQEERIMKVSYSVLPYLQRGSAVCNVQSTARSSFFFTQMRNNGEQLPGGGFFWAF